MCSIDGIDFGDVLWDLELVEFFQFVFRNQAAVALEVMLDLFFRDLVVDLAELRGDQVN